MAKSEGKIVLTRGDEVIFEGKGYIRETATGWRGRVQKPAEEDVRPLMGVDGDAQIEFEGRTGKVFIHDHEQHPGKGKTKEQWVVNFLGRGKLE